jgi:hypothetical protein
MNNSDKKSVSDNIFAINNDNNKSGKTDSTIKNTMKNLMINLPGKNFYNFGNNVKKIFEELKKT